MPGGQGVRVDTAQYAEGVVPPYYDSLIAKLIVHGCDRAEAIAKMEQMIAYMKQDVSDGVGVEESIAVLTGIFEGYGA